MDASVPQPPTPGRGFWKRHRASLLTLLLGLYTLALCVAVADEVLHLGLFPTKMESQARGFIRRFDDPDEAARRAALDEMLREVESFVAIPELIRALRSPSPTTRQVALDGLRRLAGADQGYDPEAPAEARRAAIARWRAWWKDNEHRY